MGRHEEFGAAGVGIALPCSGREAGLTLRLWRDSCLQLLSGPVGEVLHSPLRGLVGLSHGGCALSLCGSTLLHHRAATPCWLSEAAFYESDTDPASLGVALGAPSILVTPTLHIFTPSQMVRPLSGFRNPNPWQQADGEYHNNTYPGLGSSVPWAIHGKQ